MLSLLPLDSAASTSICAHVFILLEEGGAPGMDGLPALPRCSRIISTASWSSITSHTPSQATIMNWDCTSTMKMRHRGDSGAVRVVDMMHTTVVSDTHKGGFRTRHRDTA